MRGLVLVLVLATSVARAEPQAALHVAPFAGRCFDSASLVERLRARGLHAQQGGRGEQEVELTAVPDGVTVRVTAHDAAGQVTGIEQRHVADGPCDAVTETVELILVRAATPLRFMPEAPPKKPTLRHEPTRKPTPPPEPTPPTPEPHPTPPSEPTPPTREQDEVRQREQARDQAEARELAQALAKELALAREQARAHAQVPARPAVRPTLRYELAVDGSWIFPLDGAPSEPAGHLELGLRWSKRLGIAVVAGAAKPWRSIDHSGDSQASIDVFRVPIALLLTIDVALRRGHLRIDAGPLVNVWIVESRGVSAPGLTTLAQPGVEARCAYRYDVKRAFFEAGVALDVSVLREQLVVTGAGALSHTPIADVAPFLGVGVAL